MRPKIRTRFGQTPTSSFRCRWLGLTKRRTTMQDGRTPTASYWVQYKVVNIGAGAAAVTVSVGVDVAAGGGLAGPEYDMFNEVIPYPGSSGWRDLGIIAGDDDVRAVASAADDAIIRFRIRR